MFNIKFFPSFIFSHILFGVNLFVNIYLGAIKFIVLVHKTVLAINEIYIFILENNCLIKLIKKNMNNLVQLQRNYACISTIQKKKCQAARHDFFSQHPLEHNLMENCWNI